MVSDTLSNLTSLQVLDVSGNSLLDKVFIDEDNGTSIFGHLPNLTHLYLQDNRFTQVFSFELFLRKTLYVRNKFDSLPC